MGPCSRRRWRSRRWEPTRPIGEENGIKRHLLVNGCGVPLSLVVAGAGRDDVTQLDAVLMAVVVKRETPCRSNNKRLCADAG